MSTSPVRPSDPKRVLDIATALSWAYREELRLRSARPSEQAPGLGLV